MSCPSICRTHLRSGRRLPAPPASAAHGSPRAPQRLGARVKGAALWIHTVLALEQLGLDPGKDGIDILPIGDPAKVMQALEGGQIDGAVLSSAQSRQLVGKGYSVFSTYPRATSTAPPTHWSLRPKLCRSIRTQSKVIVVGMIEAAAYALLAEGKTAAIERIKSELKVTSDAAAEDGLAQLKKIIVREPYPSVERLRNMQRVMTIADPKAAEVNVAALLDDSS
jgi:hypothetical protein